MLQYKLMNKWQITKTVWPNYSISSSWVRNSAYVSSLPAFACVCSLKACILVITVITHFNGWLDLSDFCKFNEMPNRESTWNTMLFLLKIFFSTFDLCWCLETEERKKVFLIPYAAKLNAKNLFCLGLSSGFGFIPVFGLVVLWVEFNNISEDCILSPGQRAT